MLVEFDPEHRTAAIAPLAEDLSPAVREAVREGLAGRVVEEKPREYREPGDEAP